LGAIRKPENYYLASERSDGSIGQESRTLPERVKVYLFFKKQFFPFTAQSPLKAEESCDKNVDIPCLYLLDRSDIKIGKFCQLFLSHADTCPLSPHIGSEPF
jgi:hypothetical protein